MISIPVQLLETASVVSPASVETRPENHPVKVFIVKPHEIAVRQERVRASEQKIPILKAILQEEKLRPGRRFYAREGR